MSKQRLEGKVAIITGGGGGIASAAGRIFSAEGAKVALIDRAAETVEPVAEDIRRCVPGAQVLPLVVDLGTETAAQFAVDEVLQTFGKIDVLVNNVGIRRYGALADAPWDTWDDIVRVNLLSFVSMARAALPPLRQSGRGSIINVSSTYAVYGRKGMGAYDATKAAVLSLTRTLAFEEGGHGVRVMQSARALRGRHSTSIGLAPPKSTNWFHPASCSVGRTPRNLPIQCFGLLPTKPCM
ncbi:MAG: SDR family NAD(P)-dependent oxidoreductase [Bradyrhizobium sp.]